MKCHKIEEGIYHNFSEPFFCLKNTKEKWWSKQLLMNFLLSNSSINQLVIAALNHSKKFLYQESRWDIYSSVSWWSKCWFYHTTSGIFLARKRSEFYINTTGPVREMTERMIFGDTSNQTWVSFVRCLGSPEQAPSRTAVSSHGKMPVKDI